MNQMLTAGVVLMLLCAGRETENPYKARVDEAVRLAEQRPKPAVLAEALDVTWRADAWQEGRRLARLAMEKYPDEPLLVGAAARALWRAGKVTEAEVVASRFDLATEDRVTIRTAIGMCLARGELALAKRWAERLKAVGPRTATDYGALTTLAFEQGAWEGLPDLFRKTEERIRTEHGYPENLLGESIAGLAEYFEQIGPAPVNRLAQPGSAAMPPLPLVRLPGCEVMINGKGPYRLVVDTGGSILLSLDTAVAAEIGLKSLAAAPIRGVSGTQDSQQALVDELSIGTIKCERVVTRVFDIRKALMGVADGIIGTGVFQDGRMTLDFAGGQLVVQESSPEPAQGRKTVLRLVGDAKLCVPIDVADKEVVALLDTGADVVAIAPSLFKTLYPDRDHPTFDPGIPLGVGGGQLPKLTLGEGVTLDLAGKRFENYSGLGLDALDNILSPIVGIQTDLLIGMPVFREMQTLTVDYPRNALWIQWLESPRPRD